MPEPPVVALDRLHQPEVALLDQIQERQAPPGVAAGDRDDESQIGLDQPPLGHPVQVFDVDGLIDPHCVFPGR